MAVLDVNDDSSERLRSAFSAIETGCVGRIDRASVPILAVQDDRIRHGYTGVLYRIGDDHFVITAAHHLRSIVEAEVPLYLSMNRPGVMPLPLADARFHSTEEEDRDITAIWLPADLAHEVATHKDFLSHNQIDMHAADKRAAFAFFGYPKEWSGHVIADEHIASLGLALVTFGYDGSREQLSRYDPKLHMLLNVPSDARNHHRDKVEMLPDLRGISGCGVWQVGDIVGNEIRPRDENSVTLVAIEHKWSRKFGYVMATRIGYAMEFIAEMFPTARTAMNIVYPKP